jgi:hypothetical protein
MTTSHVKVKEEATTEETMEHISNEEEVEDLRCFNMDVEKK